MTALLRPFSVVFLSCLTSGVLCASSAAVSAETISAPPPAAPKAETAERASMTPQERFIQDIGDRAIAILADKASSEEERNVKFRQMLRDSFDLTTIARFVIGRSWNSATPEQQAEYMRLFEDLVVQTYSDRFALYTGEGFSVRSGRQEGERDFIVNSDITHPDGSQPTSVDWRVRQKGDKTGIIDVVVEGVSMSVTQRQEYSSVIQRNGGDIGGLLDLMRQRLREHAPVDTSAAKANNG